MPRRDYPDQIELKVENRVKRGDNTAFNTEDQKKAADHLKEHWPIQFNDLAEKEGEYTDGMYRRVLNEYFGPVGSELRFNEVWEEYGTLDQFHKRKGQRDEYDEKSFREGYDLAAKKYLKIGYELGSKGASALDDDELEELPE